MCGVVGRGVRSVWCRVYIKVRVVYKDTRHQTAHSACTNPVTNATLGRSEVELCHAVIGKAIVACVAQLLTPARQVRTLLVNGEPSAFADFGRNQEIRATRTGQVHHQFIDSCAASDSCAFLGARGRVETASHLRNFGPLTVACVIMHLLRYVSISIGIAKHSKSQSILDFRSWYLCHRRWYISRVTAAFDSLATPPHCRAQLQMLRALTYLPTVQNPWAVAVTTIDPRQGFIVAVSAA
jgi:hypothetical protein